MPAGLGWGRQGGGGLAFGSGGLQGWSCQDPERFSSVPVGGTRRASTAAAVSVSAPLKTLLELRDWKGALCGT